jgi:hypothetical protein
MLAEHIYAILLLVAPFALLLFASSSFVVSLPSCPLDSSPCVDIVITWVDGTDPLHQTDLAQSSLLDPALMLYDSSTTVSSRRFDDHDELRYALRSIDQFFPHFRHIWLVTNGQIPHWLRATDSLTVLPHEFFFGETPLPTFSSPAIEWHLHQIPQLAPHFIYFNDDMFLLRESTFDDWFVPQASHQRLFYSWPLPACAPGCPLGFIGAGTCREACNVSSCRFSLSDCPPSEEDVRVPSSLQQYPNVAQADASDCVTTPVDAYAGSLASTYLLSVQRFGRPPALPRNAAHVPALFSTATLAEMAADTVFGHAIANTRQRQFRSAEDVQFHLAYSLFLSRSADTGTQAPPHGLVSASPRTTGTAPSSGAPICPAAAEALRTFAAASATPASFLSLIVTAASARPLSSLVDVASDATDLLLAVSTLLPAETLLVDSLSSCTDAAAAAHTVQLTEPTATASPRSRSFPSPSSFRSPAPPPFATPPRPPPSTSARRGLAPWALLHFLSSRGLLLPPMASDTSPGDFPAPSCLAALSAARDLTAPVLALHDDAGVCSLPPLTPLDFAKEAVDAIGAIIDLAETLSQPSLADVPLPSAELLSTHPTVISVLNNALCADSARNHSPDVFAPRFEPIVPEPAPAVFISLGVDAPQPKSDPYSALSVLFSAQLSGKPFACVNDDGLTPRDAAALADVLQTLYPTPSRWENRPIVAADAPPPARPDRVSGPWPSFTLSGAQPHMQWHAPSRLAIVSASLLFFAALSLWF